MERSLVTPRADFLVGLRGLRQRQILGERHHAIQFRPVLLQPLEVHLRQIGGRHITTLDQWRQGRHGKEGELVESRMTRGRRMQRHFDFCARCGAWFGRLARQIRPERHCRLDIERNVDLSQRLEGLEIPVHAAQGLLLVGIREVHAEHFLGGVEHLFRDSLLLLLLRLLGQCRHRQPSGNRGRHRFEETSSRQASLLHCASINEAPSGPAGLRPAQPFQGLLASGRTTLSRPAGLRPAQWPSAS